MTLRLTFFLAVFLVIVSGSAQLFGDQQIIFEQLNPNWVNSADLDNDGDMDVLASFNSNSTSSAHIGWFENYGSGQFSTLQVITMQAQNAYQAIAFDLDVDGDMDVLSASSHKIAWYENLGGGLFGTQEVITTLVVSTASVNAADLDDDGDMDVLCTSHTDNKIAWYENLGGEVFDSEQVLSSITPVGGPRSVKTADLDGDGDLDILIAAFLTHLIGWYENMGDGNFSTLQIIASQVLGAKSVQTADIDGDDDLDVISASMLDYKIAWYENLGDGLFGTQQIISVVASNAFSVYASDLDLDGDIDVISASNGDNKIAWYENLSGGIFGVQQIISIQVNGAVSVFAADLDNDGDMDVQSASNDDNKIAWYENMTHIPGCTDQSACNYHSEATTENGSCCYTNCGCTNPLAANYLESATCDNGTCEFSITGTVFFDENENGMMDGVEYGIPFQTVVNEESGQTYVTNDEGNFIALISEQQMTIFEVFNSLTFPYNTTTNPQVFSADTSSTTQFYFGVSNQMPVFGIVVDIYPNGNGFLCNAYSNHNICFRNMGNVPIDGIIEIEYDPLFQGYQEVTSIDSVNGNFVYMSFENLLPGQMYFYDIELLTPTVEHIGEFVTSYARVYGYYGGDQVAYGEKERITEITCAYDPNDKQAYPLGYTDEHRLLQATQQEFTIRFQNTGNAPAQNIRIQDTLDVNFDIESFRFIANSHSVMTTINPETRLIDFYFENIQLPDSGSNEPASHGVISYMITPLPDLPVGTVLENTAFIYFDNNDPIITNTTWTTIHECGGESAFDASTAVICGEQQVNFESTYEFIEEYSWQVDGIEVGVNPNLLLSSIDNPEYEVTLTASNPLCTETSTLNYEVPDITSIDPCRADFNCDGNRDTEDLLIFMGEFGCLNTCAADLDSNAIVNVADLFILVSVFDQTCWE